MLKMRGKRPIFSNIFLSLVLCIVIIVAITCSLFYLNVENTMTSQISMANMKDLNLISDEVATTAKMASTISYQIYNDVTISKLLYFPSPSVYDQSLAMSQITVYQMMFPMIDSIYVYNGTTGKFYVRSNGTTNDAVLKRENFFDKQVVTLIEKHKDYRQSVPIARRYYDSDGTFRGLYYTFIMYNDIWSKNNAVVVNINEQYIQSVINEEQGDESESFIMDSKGSIVSNSTNYPMLTDVSGKDYIKHILANTASPGYFITNVSGVKSLIIYTAPDSIGWTYVRVFRWDALFSTVTKIKLILILFSLAVIVLGVISAFVITRQLYRPIHRLISNLTDLEEEKKGNSSMMKQELLREMLLDSVSETKQSLIKKYGELGVKIPLDKPLAVVLVKIDRYKDFLLHFNSEERDSLKRSILRISLEELGQFSEREAVVAGEDALVLILSGQALDSLGEGELAGVRQALADQLGVSVSIAVSTRGENADSLHDLYSQTQKAMLHRLFFGHGCVVFARDIMAYSSEGYSYPVQKEKLMIDALMENRMDDAKKQYADIVNETSTCPISVFNLTISHLLFTLNNTINIILSNNSISTGLDVGFPVVLLSEMETIQEFNANIFAIFDRLSRTLEDRKTQKHDIIVNSINEIIQAKYSDSDLSISSIADELGMSEAYICRIYKQQTLHTILESIVNSRMKKARELLKESEFSISTIAKKCGFSNSTYFYTAFKAANGVTPSDYRKNIHA